MHQNECKYDTLVHSSDYAAGKNTFKNLGLGKDDCHIRSNSFSKKLFNTCVAGIFTHQFLFFQT